MFTHVRSEGVGKYWGKTDVNIIPEKYELRNESVCEQVAGWE